MLFSMRDNATTIWTEASVVISSLVFVISDTSQYLLLL
jgi:hypothetical protein